MAGIDQQSAGSLWSRLARRFRRAAGEPSIRRAATEPLTRSDAPTLARAATFGADASTPPAPARAQNELMAEMRQRLGELDAKRPQRDGERTGAGRATHRLGQVVDPSALDALRQAAARNTRAASPGKEVGAGPSNRPEQHREEALRALEGRRGPPARGVPPSSVAQSEVEFRRNDALRRLNGDIAPAVTPGTDAAGVGSASERRVTPYPGKVLQARNADGNAQARVQPPARPQADPNVSRWSADSDDSARSSVLSNRSGTESNRASVATSISRGLGSNRDSASNVGSDRDSLAGLPPIRDSLMMGDDPVVFEVNDGDASNAGAVSRSNVVQIGNRGLNERSRDRSQVR
jgi:hypothetical protein